MIVQLRSSVCIFVRFAAVQALAALGIVFQDFFVQFIAPLVALLSRSSGGLQQWVLIYSGRSNKGRGQNELHGDPFGQVRGPGGQ